MTHTLRHGIRAVKKLLELDQVSRITLTSVCVVSVPVGILESAMTAPIPPSPHASEQRPATASDRPASDAVAVPAARDALWVSLTRMPTPEDVEVTAAQSPYVARLLAQWRAWVPASERDGTGDVEDFWEMAARLDAALASPVTDLYLAVAGVPVRHLCFAGDDAIVEEDNTVTTVGEWVLAADLSREDEDSLVAQINAGSLLYYGPYTRFSRLEFAGLNPADQYPHSQWFNCHAGRDVLLAGYFPLSADENNRMPEPGEKRVEDVMAMFATYGYTEVIIKMVRAKHGMWRIPTSTDPEANREVLINRLGWSLIGVEGSANTMLVQQIVPMRFEYRVFIVDGLPVTGAGCVEEHTPLHANPETPFSPLVRENRRYTLPASEDESEFFALSEPAVPEPVQSRPEVVERLVKFAGDVAHDLSMDGSPFGRAYVLDVALDDEDVPLLIEANGITNAGLYASDPRRVVRALVR